MRLSGRRVSLSGRCRSAGPPDRRNVLVRSARPPDLVLRYGAGPDHVADVHLPSPEAVERSGIGGRALFTIFLHGGFWRAQYGREHTAPLAEALAEAGFAVCAPEYRRSGQREGGWPCTFDDVAAAVDRLPALVGADSSGIVATEHMVLAGHSAGGHLALWAASRHRLPARSPWRTDGAPAGCGVVALAAVSDLAQCHELRLGQRAADALMGGGPARFPERYAVSDPARLVPIGLPVRLVHGTADDRVPHEMSVGYAARARAAGDDRVVCTLLPGAGHFDVIDPLSGAWPAVEGAFRSAAPPVERPGG
jgi:acetyl esterase/lipase